MNETFPSEIGSSYHHAKNAAELMNKTYHLSNAISAVDFRIIYEEEQSNNDDNSTVQALVIANIVDEILRKYEAAYNIDYDLTNMSNMEMSNTASMSEHVGKKHFDIIGIIGTKGSELKLVDIADYQSAQALSVEANKIFEVILKPAAQVDNHNNNNNNNSIAVSIV